MDELWSSLINYWSIKNNGFCPPWHCIKRIYVTHCMEFRVSSRQFASFPSRSRKYRVFSICLYIFSGNQSACYLLISTSWPLTRWECLSSVWAAGSSRLLTFNFGTRNWKYGAVLCCCVWRYLRPFSIYFNLSRPLALRGIKPLGFMCAVCFIPVNILLWVTNNPVWRKQVI